MNAAPAKIASTKVFSRRSGVLRLVAAATLLLTSCASRPTESTPAASVQPVPTTPGLPTLATSSSLMTTSAPSSLPLRDELGLPPADFVIDSEPGASISAEAFRNLDVGDNTPSDARQIIAAHTPVGEMGYYSWSNDAGERCVGFVEPSLSSWGCGDVLPDPPPDRPAWVRLGAAWGDERYAVTPDLLPESVIAIDAVMPNGYRVRSFPIEGYAILADNLENGLPMMIVVHFDDGTELSQATNFLLAGPS